MRRNERAMASRAEIDDVIRRCQVCRLGLADGLEPYIVPMCFGYDGRALYFHCAPGGRKLEILQRNPRVCFEFDLPEQVVEAPEACGWGIRYQSVMGAGSASRVEALPEKRRALDLIMAQYAALRAFTFPEPAVDRVAILQVNIETISGKQSHRC